MKIAILGPSFALLILCFQRGGQGQKLHPFPISDRCEKQDIDLLLLADVSGNPSTVSGDLRVQMLFFEYLVKGFLASQEDNLTRLHVAVAMNTNSGPKMLIYFQDYSDVQELITKMMNITLTNDESLVESNTSTNVLRFLHQSFASGHGSRDNVTCVAILVLHGDISADIAREIGDLQNQGLDKESDLRLFVALVGLGEAENRQDIRRIGYKVSVSSFEELLDNPYFAMMMCSKCMVKLDGMILWKSNSTHFGQFSCYQLYRMPKPGTWLDASNWCSEKKAQLFAYEDYYEFTLHARDIAEIGFRLYKKSRYKHLYIGLTRDSETLAKRFQWVNKRPAVSARWESGRPSQGPDQGCSAVRMDELDNEKRSYYFETITLDLESYDFPLFVFSLELVDLGCGIVRSDLALCEMSIAYPLGQQEASFLNPEPANNKSYNSALSRGEFIEFEGSIVSVPALTKDNSKIELLKLKGHEIPLFGCDESGKQDEHIPYAFVCDHRQDCDNGQDEQVCRYRNCDPDTEFQCSSHQCVPLEAHCDLYPDCLDGSDEVNCQVCIGQSCCDGTSLPSHWFPDGQIDCPSCRSGKEFGDNFVNDEYDPINKEPMPHEMCMFICNRTKCVLRSQLNDNVTDCQGPEGPLDETIGKFQTSSYCVRISGGDLEYSTTNMPWTPECIYIKDRYGGILGCRTMSHLKNCDFFKCPEGYVKCPRSYCIPLHLVQDGRPDCKYGEDEMYIDNYNCTGNFACWNSSVCLHPDLVCDGHLHCPSGDDELHCSVTCSHGFSCIAGSVTVTRYDTSQPLSSFAFIVYRTRYLDMSGVDLSAEFLEQQRGHFPHLFHARFSNCQLKDALGKFVLNTEHLATVSSMDLSYNLIQEITKDSMFNYMENLKRLDLSYNQQLYMIQKGGLNPVNTPSILERLNLAGTGIVSLDGSVFQTLSNLRYLNLSKTFVSILENNSFPIEFILIELDLRFTTVEIIQPASLSGLIIEAHLYTDNYQMCCPQVKGTGIPEHTCHAPQDPISSCTNLVAKNIHRVLLWLVGVTAVFGNAIIVLYKPITGEDGHTKPASVFTTNLAVSDMIMGVYLFIIVGADIYYTDEYVLNEHTWRHSVLCQTAGFLATLACETSTIFIFLITLHGCILGHFHWLHSHWSKMVIIACCIGTWSVGFLLALIPVLPTLEHWKIYSANALCLDLPIRTQRPAGTRYSFAVFIAFNFITLIAVACGQFLICWTNSSKNTKSNNETVVDVNRGVGMQQFLVAMTKFLCWFTIGIMGWIALGGREISLEVYSWTCVLVLPIQSALNPVIQILPIIQHKWEMFKTVSVPYSEHR